MLEKSVEQHLVKLVRAKKGLAIKLVPVNFAGLPDRLVLLPNGIMFFVELKRPKKNARPLQESVHRILRNLGFLVFVIDTKTGVDEVLSCYRV